ncbi:hypothetical protein GCM10025794_28490 [Massilia kyonggiensis]|jgi:hypothetical protein
MVNLADLKPGIFVRKQMSSLAYNRYKDHGLMFCQQYSKRYLNDLSGDLVVLIPSEENHQRKI